MCKKIHRGGNAEKYHADKKYKEAVAVAVEACAEDTKGQTCYICAGNSAHNDMLRMCACQGTAGFVHLSCLAERAKILFAEAEENNLGAEKFQTASDRWHTCSLCGQRYHGVVACALGWACWKKYLGRPETDQFRCMAMTILGNGLAYAQHHEDALSVGEAELSMLRRIGAPEQQILVAQSNLSNTYHLLRRFEEALSTRQEVYSGRLKLNGEEHKQTLRAAYNYAFNLLDLQRFGEARSLLLKTMPVARRVLGESNDTTLGMRCCYAEALYKADGATLDDLREAVTTLEDAGRIARRVFGGAYPITVGIEESLRDARAASSARETPSDS